MGTIRFVRGDDKALVPLGDYIAASPTWREKLGDVPPGELQANVFMHHPGGADTPRLFEVGYPPGTKVEPHAHDVDEIIVVTQGELRFGRQVFGPGSSVFIPARTLYSFQAGDEGATFLNFRPTGSDKPDILFAHELVGSGDA